MRYFLLLTFSIFSFADDHRISTDFSDCDGKVVNYYVSKIVSGGSVEGMMKASKMHQNFYDEQGANVKVYPALQYLRNDDGTEEKLHRVSTMVVWDSVNSWSEWRESIEALSEEDRKLADKKYKLGDCLINLQARAHAVYHTHGYCHQPIIRHPR